ncbi:uncharacterized protein rgn isoform X2 [Ochlerotatus camptorhynchus]|uniref:uncharacterized protein rgn isoform X2 n=1 Tax=Ochlerotatus camptorhynchus TaxID=644619 RepID=UPI0031DB240C
MRTNAMMGTRTIVIAVFCLLTVFLTVSTAQSQYYSEQQQQQQHQQQIQQYDPNTPPQHPGEHISGRRFKRMYAMCPPHFFRIGNECYFISQSRLNWLDAHFECKDRNSKLAEPMKYDDKNLRKFLQTTKEKNFIWIGGNYNWRANKWQWGYNGKDIGYQSFSQMVPGQDLKFHCAVLSPEVKFRWSAKICTEKLNFICQHKMPFVNSHSRSKVYTRWNETFPNELANEVEVVVANQPRSNKQRDFYRTSSNSTVNSTVLYNRFKNKKQSNRAHRIKASRVKNFIGNDVIRQPVVGYVQSHNSINGNGNGYHNGNGAFMRDFNVDIHPQKKINRKYEADNGESRPHQHRHHLTEPNARPATAAPASATTTVTTTTTTTPTTAAPETLPTEALHVVTENYQPNQPQENKMSRRDKLRERLARLTPEERKQFFAKRGTTTEKYQPNQPQLSHGERKDRRNKLRERLAQLTPEERDMFFAERAKRKRVKKQRAKNETIP